MSTRENLRLIAIASLAFIIPLRGFAFCCVSSKLFCSLLNLVRCLSELHVKVHLCPLVVCSCYKWSIYELVHK